MPCQLVFPARADMSSVASLREEWLSKIEGHRHAKISCAQVELITAATAQMVVALGKALHASGGAVSLVDVSPALREDLMLLGLTHYIEEAPRHV